MSNVTPVAAVAVKKLLPRDLKVLAGGFAMTIWTADLDESMTLDDTAKPEFWAHVADKLNRGDEVKIRAYDKAPLGTLFVRATGQGWAKVGIMERWAAPDAALKEPEGSPYEAKWNVGRRGYDVVRKSDRQVIQPGDKFPLREDALAWIAEHLKAMAA